jgi:hypothetical protein
MRTSIAVVAVTLLALLAIASAASDGARRKASAPSPLHRSHQSLSAALQRHSSVRGHHHTTDATASTLGNDTAAVEWLLVFARPQAQSRLRAFASDMSAQLSADGHAPSTRLSFTLVGPAHRSQHNRHADTTRMALYRSVDGVSHARITTLLMAEQRREDSTSYGLTAFERQHKHQRLTRPPV